MAPRSFWKGYLKLSLVTCPVTMLPAISEGDKFRFHTINRQTGHRVQSQLVDAITGDEVDDDSQVKGYPRGEHDYVLLEDAELDAVALESARTIDIDIFTAGESIEWVWYDTPHFLIPNDPVGEEAFSVIREAMHSTKTVGIARLVLYRRERAVLLQPRGKGIILWTLRYGDEVRDPADYFGKIKDAGTDPELAGMVTKIIEQRSQPWNSHLVHDQVQSRLLDMIKSKKKPAKLAARSEPEEETPSNVIDIVDALRRSLVSEKKRR